MTGSLDTVSQGKNRLDTFARAQNDHKNRC